MIRAKRTLFTPPTFNPFAQEGVKVVERIAKSPQHLFNVASDVQLYHEFVPFCERSEIYDEKIYGRNRQMKSFKAKLFIKYPITGTYTSFTSDVELHSQIDAKEAYRIRAVNADNNVFTKLETVWTIVPAHKKLENDFGSLSYTQLKYIIQNEEFPSNPDESLVRLDIDYEFKDSMLQFLAETSMGAVSRMMISRFKLRAGVY